MGEEKSLIVVGVDGSAASRAALAWAAKQAEMTGAELRAVTSWHIPAMSYGAALVYANETEMEKANAEALQRTIDEVLGPEPSVPVTARTVEGPAALVLVEASTDADLLVMGSRGHGAFTGMLLGSVSEYCVAHASCPVVVIRDPLQQHNS